MAKSKQRTECGAYSAQDLDSSGGPDKIRNVDWGPYEGSRTPRNTNLVYIDMDNSVGSGRIGDDRDVGHRPRKMD